MGAFFSGTDDANENATQFYGVWGQVNKEEPAIAFRFVCGDQKIQISPDVLFEWPSQTKSTYEVIEAEGQEPVTKLVSQEKTLIKGPFEAVDYPEDWMGQHQKSVLYTRPGTTYGSAYGGAYGRNGYQNGKTTPSYQKENGYGAYGFDYDYDYDYDQHSYGKNQKTNAPTAGGTELTTKKEVSLATETEVNQNDVDDSTGNITYAKVTKVHSSEDVAHYGFVEKEASEIAAELEAYGFDKVIEAVNGAIKRN